MKNQISEFRKKLNLSRNQLAIKLGVTENTIYEMETGKYIPSLKLAYKLSVVFECKIDNIFDFNKEDSFKKEKWKNKSIGLLFISFAFIVYSLIFNLESVTSSLSYLFVFGIFLLMFALSVYRLLKPHHSLNSRNVVLDERYLYYLCKTVKLTLYTLLSLIFISSYVLLFLDHIDMFLYGQIILVASVFIYIFIYLLKIRKVKY